MYRVVYQGEILVDGVKTPAFAACQALLARGITGKLAVFSVGGITPRMTMDIEKAAGFAISEGEMSGLKLVPHKEFRREVEEELQAA